MAEPDDGAPDDGAPVDLRCSMLFFRGDRVLLCHRIDDSPAWVLPGGTPRIGESTALAARREVEEETGLQIAAERVAFVMETADWSSGHRIVEIVFVGSERDSSLEPRQVEQRLEPVFVPVQELNQIELMPPIAGYIRGFARSPRSTAAFLGNVWRPIGDADNPRTPSGEDNGDNDNAGNDKDDNMDG